MIATVVNSFQRRDLLAKALPSLHAALAQAGGPTGIMVFDAGSTDGSREYVDGYAAEHPDLDLRQIKATPEMDTTFSGGINAGCAEALARWPGVKWFVLFETDNWIQDFDPVARAIELLETHGELGAVGYTVAKYSGVRTGFGASFPTIGQFVLGPQLCYRWGLDAPKVLWQKTDGISWTLCDAVYTSPIVIRRQAWEESGGLDAQAFPFSECDLDWAWRLAEKGWKQAVIETEGVIHDNCEQLSGWSKLRALRFHQARWRLLRRWRKASGAWLPALWLRHVAEVAAMTLGVATGRVQRDRLQARIALLRAAMGGYEQEIGKKS